MTSETMTIKFAIRRHGDGPDVDLRYRLSPDAPIDDVAECLRGFLFAAGYTKDTVDEAVPPG